VSDTLKEKMALFKNNARFFRENEELFGQPSWVQVMVGQRLVPTGHSPLVNLLSQADLEEYVANVREVVKRCVDFMPTHQQFIDKYCAAPKVDFAMLMKKRAHELMQAA
jgi:tryptophan 7-halogenase